MYDLVFCLLKFLQRKKKKYNGTLFLTMFSICFFTLVLVRSRTLYQKSNLQKSLDRPLNASNCIHNGAYCVKKLKNLSYVYSYWYIRASYNKSGNRKSIINLSYSKSSIFFNFSFSLVTYSLLTHLLPM